MRNRSVGSFYAAAASVMALLGVVAPTSGKAATITQVVTILGHPQSGATIGAGSTSFSRFDPALGTLDAVTFGFPNPYLGLPTFGVDIPSVSFNYRGGSSGPLGGTIDRESYTLMDPTGALNITSQVSHQFTVNGQTFYSVNSDLLGEASPANTSDPFLAQYIGLGMSALEYYSPVDNAEDFVDINGYCPFGCDNNIPQLSITYNYTPAAVGETPLPAALPLFATGLGALCLLGMREKRKKNAAMAAA